MNWFDSLIGVLKKKSKTKTNAEIAKILSYKNGAQISISSKNPPSQSGVQERLFIAFYDHAYKKGYAEANKNNAQMVIDIIKEKNVAMTQTEIAKIFGIHQPVVSHILRGEKELSKKMLQKVIGKKNDNFQINPIFEYVSINPTRKGQGWELSSRSSEIASLRLKLEAVKSGVYVFYSSIGTPTYVGMTTNNMYFEIRQRLKAPIQSGQYGLNDSGELKRYDHRGKKVKTGHSFQQGDVTGFISVYEIKPESDKIVKTIEALMIRSFINAIENNQLQSFPK